MQDNKTKSSKTMIGSFVAVFLMVFLDQITKYFAAVKLKGQEPFPLIDGVFQLRYLENQSAAFSFDPISFLHKIFHISFFNAHPDAFLACKMAFFVILTVAVLIFLGVLYRRIPWNRHFFFMNLVFIGFFAGAIGNLIDRIMHNYVIDFFDFTLINFPIFNVADIYVTISAIALILMVFFVYKEEDYEVIFAPKKNTDKKES